MKEMILYAVESCNQICVLFVKIWLNFFLLLTWKVGGWYRSRLQIP